MSNCKILIVEKKLFHYRIPFFNALTKEVKELTVCHSGEPSHQENLGFKEVILPSKKYNRFIIQPGLSKLAKEFNVVITKFDMQWLSMIKLNFQIRRSYKLLCWGIGVSSDKGFDQDHSKDWARFYLAKKSDALIFYSDYPKKKYVRNGISQKKIFVANNTTYVDTKGYVKRKGEYLLFVGSLHKRKKIGELLIALKLLKNKGEKIQLKIIGKGGYKPEIQNKITQYELTDCVKLYGEIKGDELNNYFSNAIATVSPGQAGLSVLESLAHGVPFITKVDSITGGERLNIKNGYNGILYEGGEKELSEILSNLINDENYQIKLAKNAEISYEKEGSLDLMVDGFMDAINYVMN